MGESIETVIVGAGVAGLSTSYSLKQLGREHLVLDAADRAAEPWRNHRWDSFTLVTPNWSLRFPDGEYDGPDPHGFMGREEIVRRFEEYIRRQQLPVRYGARVTAVRPEEDGRGFTVQTRDRAFQARNVILANGWCGIEKIPPFASKIPAHILQLRSGDYRNPRALPPGAVLVVGCGQSGAQIAEELYQSGRRVFLATGGASRAPRRYRGRDIFDWLVAIGFFDRSLDMLRAPQERRFSGPQLTGKGGGHTLNLHQFARDGVVLLGHLLGYQDGLLCVAPDVKDNLARADQAEQFLLKSIDDYIQRAGIDAPEDHPPVLTDAYRMPEVLALDLRAESIGTIIWACGYTYDASLVQLPIYDEFGLPRTRHGAAELPGLYYVGLPWLAKLRSGFLNGMADDAGYVAGHIAGRAGKVM
jgi:putative flavoprotein involved in K+ transport